MAEKGIIEQFAASTVVVEPPVASAVRAPLEYPDTDGRFLPDHPLQGNAIMELRNSLQGHFQQRGDVTLAVDMFLYYAKGVADDRLVLGRRVGKFVAPHLMVVLDHDLGERGVYKLWEEGKPPDFVMEVVSPSSEVRSRKDKRKLYAGIGVREYFLFQPDVRRREPRLVGYELGELGYRELVPECGLPGSVKSPVLGVSFRPEGALLRVRDVRSGKDYYWNTELPRKIAKLAEKQEKEASARRQAEAARRQEARFRREAEAARRQEARFRREAKAARRQEARFRREAKAALHNADLRVQAAEARIAELKAELRRGGQSPRDQA